MVPLLLAANTSAWVYLGPLLAGLGGLGAGLGTVWAQRNKSKTDRADYQSSLLQAMQGHLNYMSEENKSQRQRIDALEAQARKDQQDKYEMQVELTQWKHKWEERISGTSPAP